VVNMIYLMLRFLLCCVWLLCMRCLFLVSGSAKKIVDVVVPSLFSRGLFVGDVVVFVYVEQEYSSEQIGVLESRGVVCVFVEKMNEYVSLDRFRVYFEYVKDLYQNYDVIMLSHDDVLFACSLDGLFVLAKDVLCVSSVFGGVNCSGVKYLSYVEGAKPELFIDSYNMPREWFDTILGEQSFNSGIISGPAKEIFNYLSFFNGCSKMFVKPKDYNGFDTFVLKELLLNVWIYYFKPVFKDVGWQWNCIDSHPLKAFNIVDNKIVATGYDDSKNQMFIIHMQIGEIEALLEKGKLNYPNIDIRPYLQRNNISDELYRFINNL